MCCLLSNCTGEDILYDDLWARLPQLQGLASSLGKVIELTKEATADPVQFTLRMKAEVAQQHEIILGAQEVLQVQRGIMVGARQAITMLNMQQSLASGTRRNVMRIARTMTLAAPPLAPAPPEGEQAAPHSFRCVADGCSGFVLSATMRCGMCNVQVCDTCEQRKEAGHVCRQEDISSVHTIRDSTKACPHCEVRIHKSEGCNDMFCTNCHGAFNYRTGNKIDRLSGFHNPHYTQFMHDRQHAGPDVACTDATSAAAEYNHIRPHLQLYQTDARIRNIVANLGNMRRVIDYGRPPQEAFTPQLEELACMFLAKQLDEATLKRQVFLVDRQRRFTLEHFEILEAASMSAVGALRVLIPAPASPPPSTARATQVIEQLHEISTYFNDALTQLSKSFNRCTYVIGDGWYIHMRRGQERKRRHPGDAGPSKLSESSMPAHTWADTWADEETDEDAEKVGASMEVKPDDEAADAATALDDDETSRAVVV
jgi:hypothetical protein